MPETDAPASSVNFDPRTHLPDLDRFIRSSLAYARQRRIDFESADRPLRVLYGVNIQAIRHAAAFLHLRKSEFATEAGVNARAALEHAVTAQWAYFTTDGVDRLANSTQHDLKEFATSAGEWLDRDDVRQQAAAMEDAGKPRLPKFTGDHSTILGSIANADTFLKLSYKVLSQPSHVSSSAGLGYIRQLGDRAFEFRSKAEANYDYPSTYAAAAASMLASWIQALVSGDQKRQSTLDELSNRLGLPVSLEEHIDPKWRSRAET